MCRASDFHGDRRRPAAPFAAIVSAALVAAPALAQQREPPAQPPSVSTQLEQYLSTLGLDDLLSAHLARQLRDADGAERARIAARLTELQVKAFERAATPEQERQWEQRTRELLAAVPEAETVELRFTLAKARYRRVEPVAERVLRGVADPGDREAAAEELAALAALFGEVGREAGRSVDTFNRRLETARDQEAPMLRSALEQAARLRSGGHYFAGWASLYHAQLAGSTEAAERTLVHFGVLLDAPPGRPATLDRLPEAALKWDHVARAAVACGVAESIRGRHDVATRWLDVVADSPDTPEDVRSMVATRRIGVLASAGRWSELETWLETRRSRAGKDARVPPMDARLACMLALEALERLAPDAPVRPRVQAVVDGAMRDLIAAGELRHVADLSARHPSLALPGEGFLPHYVRGLQRYEAARTRHRVLGHADEPAAEGALAAEYQEAAEHLERAMASPDADRFAAERGNAAFTLGLARYFARDLRAAATQLLKAEPLVEGAAAEDALWLAIVALDRLVRGGATELQTQWRAAATRFLERHPRTDRAVNLLLSQQPGALASESQAVELLRSVDASSPIALRARRRAADLLYNAFARAPETSRDAAGSAFLAAADDVLSMERRAAAEPGSPAQDSAAAIVARLRQVLDVLLASAAPDVTRARQALDEARRAAGSLSTGAAAPLEAEWAYRQLQIAAISGDVGAQAGALEALERAGGPFVGRAHRLLFARASRAMTQASAPDEVLRDVVRHGSRLLDLGEERAGGPRELAIRDAVAEAAARLWAAGGDAAMRDIALTHDRVLLARDDPPARALHRAPPLMESAGDERGALDLWRRVLAARAPRSPEWFEARYHSLRLLARLEPPRAREAMSQFATLHPDMGGAAWRDRFRDLQRQLDAEGTPPQGGSP